MMPRLIAEESMLLAERVGVGTGTYDKATRRRILASWRREALSGTPATPLGSPTMLPALGIGYTVVPPRG